MIHPETHSRQRNSGLQTITNRHAARPLSGMRRCSQGTAVAVLILAALHFGAGTAAGQGLGLNNANPHASSILDLKATDRGLLIPRMGEAQKYAIAAPATGLLIFQTDAPMGYYFYDSSAWIKLTSNSEATWTKSGNYVYNTTDSIGIGTANPASELHVEGNIRVKNNGTVRANGTGNIEIGNSNALIKIGGDPSWSIIEAKINHLSLQTSRDIDDIVFKGGATTSEYMRIESGTGNVGIGTSTPGSKLSILGAVAIDKKNETDTARLYFQRYANGVLNNKVGALIDWNNAGHLRFFTTHSQSSSGSEYGYFQFYMPDHSASEFTINKWTAGNALGIATGSSALFKVDNDGNVGIGTDIPSSKLYIDGGDIKIAQIATEDPYIIRSHSNSNSLWFMPANAAKTPKLVLADAHQWDRSVEIGYNAGTTGAGAGILRIGQISKNGADFTHGITALYTNGTERIRITNDGDVGIGTPSPTAGLDVFEKAIRARRDNDQYVEMVSNTASGSYLRGHSRETNQKILYIENVYNTNGTGAGTLDIRFKIGNESSSTTVMTLEDDYQVGIGTTDPTELLHVAGNVLIEEKLKYRYGTPSSQSITTTGKVEKLVRFSNSTKELYEDDYVIIRHESSAYEIKAKTNAMAGAWGSSRIPWKDNEGSPNYVYTWTGGSYGGNNNGQVTVTTTGFNKITIADEFYNSGANAANIWIFAKEDNTSPVYRITSQALTGSSSYNRYAIIEVYYD